MWKNTVVKKTASHFDDEESDSSEEEALTSIICMNKSERKFYVYSENGLLLNRINFGQKIKVHGDIVAISNSGLNFVLKRSHEELVDLCTSNEYSLFDKDLIN